MPEEAEGLLTPSFEDAADEGGEDHSAEFANPMMTIYAGFEVEGGSPSEKRPKGHKGVDDLEPDDGAARAGSDGLVLRL